MHVSLLAILQFTLFIINLIVRVCGKSPTIFVGLNFVINILMLGLGLLGLNSRVPNA